MKTSGLVRLLFLSIVGGCSTSADQAVSPQLPSRAQFARSMSLLKPGMTEDEVVARLGKPDQVRSFSEPRSGLWAGAPVLWCWGTDGPGTPPTLGAVHFTPERKVHRVSGGEGSPPDPAILSEQQIRSLIPILDRVPAYQNWITYRPQAVIQAVNALQPLGKTAALAALKEYLRVTPFRWYADGPDGVFLVLRCLFDVPENPGVLPAMMVGVSSEEPADRSLFPRFPMTLVGDIPILLAKGYSGSGATESPERHLVWFEKHGVFRAAPLRPTSRALEVLDELEKTVNRIPAAERRRPDLAYATRQVFGLLSTVYRANPALSPEALRRLGPEIARLDLRWDDRANRYTFADGSVLPAEPDVEYPKERWSVRAQDTDVQVTVARHNSRFVFVRAEWLHPEGAPKPPSGRVLVLGTENPSAPLASLEVGGEIPEKATDGVALRQEDKGTRYRRSDAFALTGGQSIRLELQSAGATVPGPTVRP
jgi:hypothetical protein